MNRYNGSLCALFASLFACQEVQEDQVVGETNKAPVREAVKEAAEDVIEEPLDKSEEFIQVASAFVPPENVQSIESADGTYKVYYHTIPEVIESLEPFDLRFWVSSQGESNDSNGVTSEFEIRSVEQVRVDASMPQHEHGMNRLPLTESSPEGGFVAKGMFFHMPGYWEIYVDVQNGALTERAQFSIEID